MGTAQSMAVYQNGMRVNESFGEVVQWDLVPDFAINSMQIFAGGDLFSDKRFRWFNYNGNEKWFNFQGANFTASGVLTEELMRF